MLIIRLQRIGKRGQAYFRVVILEHTTRPKGKYLELLGTYNPHQKEFKVKKDKIEYWISKGAQLSPTVNNLLVNYKIMDRPKVQSWKPKKTTEARKGIERAEIKTTETQKKMEKEETKTVGIQEEATGTQKGEEVQKKEEKLEEATTTLETAQETVSAA